MDLENLEKLVQKYPYVSRKEIEIIRETLQFSTYIDSGFEIIVEGRNGVWEDENTNGRESVIGGPLVQLLSVHFLPSSKTIQLNKRLKIFGEIYAELCDTASGKTIFHDFYCDDAQFLGPSGGPLTLTGPDCSDWPLPYNRNTRIVVDVSVGESRLFGEQQFCCAEEEETITDLEAKELKFVHGDLGSLVLRYVAMPFAVYGKVSVEFFRKEPLHDVRALYGSRSVDVKGKIVARYGGNNPSQVCCTLFEKESNSEFERVEFVTKITFASLRLSRCWVCLPAYSSLVLDVDLSEFGTERKLLKETMELRVGNCMVEKEELIEDDDFFLKVTVEWFGPTPQGRQESYDMELEENELSDEEMSSGDEQMTEASCFPVASSLNLASNWALRAHQSRPVSTPSIEVFSVFIGRENFKPLQVYGSIVVSSYACAFYVFKRETKEDAFVLSEHCQTIPVLDGSRAYEDALKMEFDLKDVESRLHIRGYTKWEERWLQEGSKWLDKQLCSVVPGENGCFAAIHYTIFSKYAVQANIEVSIPNDEHGHVYGSIVAQYNNYDYTSRYNKDLYRITLFQRNEEDPAQRGLGGVIPLSRTRVVVPINSSLIIEAKLWNGVPGHFVSCSREFQIGKCDSVTSLDGEDSSIHILLKWDEVTK